MKPPDDCEVIDVVVNNMLLPLFLLDENQMMIVCYQSLLCYLSIVVIISLAFLFFPFTVGTVCRYEIEFEFESILDSIQEEQMQ